MFSCQTILNFFYFTHHMIWLIHLHSWGDAQPCDLIHSSAKLRGHRLLRYSMLQQMQLSSFLCFSIISNCKILPNVVCFCNFQAVWDQHHWSSISLHNCGNQLGLCWKCDQASKKEYLNATFSSNFEHQSTDQQQIHWLTIVPLYL